MQLKNFAETILFGNTLDDKLVPTSAFEDTAGQSALPFLPRFPGRPKNLSTIGKASFPSAKDLKEDAVRGRLLHFFANHELMAMELMALILLRFPQADPEFRLGLAHTMREEQKHLRMYVERMRELGVDFGAFPVSDYFWNALKGVTSPLEFVVQMSLTLEQANLDFSLYYQDAVLAVGDTKTASILDIVYREEIGHVKHGLHWFNRWRKIEGSNEDDWDAYLRLLPQPMTPRRAKGPIFAAAARRAAGFSPRYIDEMEVYTGSKGRPPTLWYYNPLCEAEIARGKPGYQPPQKVQRIGQDLETLPAFLARETDVVLVHELPRPEWLKTLQGLGVTIPEFRKMNGDESDWREANLAGLEPWGWSPEVFERFRPARERLIPLAGANGEWAAKLLHHPSFTETPLAPLFSKRWSLDFFQRWLAAHPEDETAFGGVAYLGKAFETWNEAETFLRTHLTKDRTYLAKAPWGTSGTLNKKILDVSELSSALGGWIQNTIETQGSIIIEPWLEKEVDLSTQIEVGDSEIRFYGIRRFLTGGQLEYQGTFLEPKLNSLTAEQTSFLHTKDEGNLSRLARWHQVTHAVGKALRESGFRGPAGIDAMIWRNPQDGRLLLRPVVEVNPRWTMGRVALSLEDCVVRGTPAAWLFLSRPRIKALGLPENLESAAQILQSRYPCQMKIGVRKSRISEGVTFTTDPRTARELLTMLVVGEKAMEELVRAHHLR
jgi:uncharacterized ferritin-like protein (DUF455 family)